MWENTQVKDHKIVDLILERAKEVEEELDFKNSSDSSKLRGMSDKSLSIEQRSFQIIDAEVGQHEYSQSESNIVT